MCALDVSGVFKLRPPYQVKLQAADQRANSNRSSDPARRGWQRGQSHHGDATANHLAGRSATKPIRNRENTEADSDRADQRAWCEPMDRFGRLKKLPTWR